MYNYAKDPGSPSKKEDSSQAALGRTPDGAPNVQALKGMSYEEGRAALTPKAPVQMQEEGEEPSLHTHTTKVVDNKAPSGSIKIKRGKEFLADEKVEELEGGGTRTTKTTAGVSATPELKIKDGKFAGVGASSEGHLGREVTTATKEGDADVTRTKGIAGKASLGYKDGATTVGAGADLKSSKQVVTTDEDGVKRTDTVTDKAGVSTSRKYGKDGEVTNTVGASVGRDWSKKEERTEDGQTITDEQKTGLRGSATKSTTGEKLGAELSRENIHTVVMEDGTKIVTKDKNALKGELAKNGIKIGVTRTTVASEKTESLSEKTTLTTTKDKREYGTSATVGKDADGNFTIKGDAKASATAYSQKLKHNFDDVGPLGQIVGEAGYEAGKAQVNAGAAFGRGEGGAGIKVTGNAGASLTMVGASAKLSAVPFSTKLFGEEVDVQVYAGVNAALLAEAKGTINFNVGGKGGGAIGVDITGGDGKVSLFAGVKAGVEVGAKLRWKRSAGDYDKLAMKTIKSLLPGKADDWLLDKLPAEVWPQIVAILLGSGSADVVAAKAGAKATAGIGGDAAFNLGLGKGTINVSAQLGATLGLGGGLKTDLLLNYFDGTRFLAVAAMRGFTYVCDKIQEAKDVFAHAKELLGQKIKEHLDEKKKKGNFWERSGSIVADFVADKVLALY